MNKWFAIALLIPCTALAREESIAEMSARFRMFCNQQAKEHRAECHQNARDRVAVESARREADRAEKQRTARTYRLPDLLVPTLGIPVTVGVTNARSDSAGISPVRIPGCAVPLYRVPALRVAPR